MSVSEIKKHVKTAKEQGSTRLCMGASGREVTDQKEFDKILEIVTTVANLGMEPCCTLGMLTKDQALALKDAGLESYNHNLDTSPEFYGNIITTRTYQDRLDTLQNVREAGISVCSGGIIGMGESLDDRIGLLEQLANQKPHPNSIPINLLVKIKGTIIKEPEPVHPFEFIRLIATARILMPLSFVRLSAGRTLMSDETQAFCFFAGANSIHAGEKLLTTENKDIKEDEKLMERLGLNFLTGKELSPLMKRLH